MALRNPVVVAIGMLAIGGLVITLGVALVYIPAALILAGAFIALFGAAVLRGSRP
jgi:hypothetical protein